MGDRGPQPEPTAIKAKRGNPGHRPLNDREPKPTGAPEYPDWMMGDPDDPDDLGDPIARRAWDSFVEDLAALGLATLIDAATLGRYCRHFVLWNKSRKVLDIEGEVYEVKNGMTGIVTGYAPRPEVAIYWAADAAMQAIERQFGMTPSARSKIKVDAPKTKTKEELEKEAFFSGGSPFPIRPGAAGAG